MMTPKKVYHRNSDSGASCRLCGMETETRHLVRVFNKKDLAFKVFTACGIEINEEESNTCICRKCENFVGKICDFRHQCQKVQHKDNQQVSIKRCPVTSPSSTPTGKQAKINEHSTVVRQLFPSNNGQVSTDQITVDVANHTTSTTSANKFVSEIAPSVDLISDSQKEKLVRAANTKQASAVAHIIHNHCPNVFAEVKKCIISDISTSVRSLCKRSRGSCLYGHNYEDMSELEFEKIWEEISITNSFLIDIFNAVTGKDSTTDEIQVKYSFIYSILMNVRWHELSVLQRINTVLMIEGGCTKQLQHRLNKFGVCLSHCRRDILLKLMGGHFLDQSIKMIKEGSTFRGTGDNWDLRILKGHMRKDVQNEDLHLFASNLIGNRINFNSLSNDEPKRDIRHLNSSNIIPNKTEMKMYAQSAKVIVGRILLEFFPKFSFLKHTIPDHIHHAYSIEMSQRSQICSLPIINANESSYNDCVLILRTYERWISEIYHEAGLLPQIPHADNPPLPSNTATPGQTNAHTPDSANDVMKDMKIPFSGDQLTRVRFAGAKDLLSGSHTATDRFEHCSPFKPVMWHTRASLLQYSYSLLYKAESVNQIGTLKYFRERFNRRNATPARVLDSFEGSEELFLSMGRSYIVVAAMKFFGMEALDDRPTLHKFPVNIIHASAQKKKEYFDDTFDKLIENLLKRNDEDFHPPMVEDRIRNYASCCIFLTLLILQMKDTAKEADGERNLVNQKLLLLVFKSLGSYSKYAIEMFVSIVQIECLLTPRLSEQFKWGFFTNWRGGAGCNIEDDLAQEISNRISKGIVQRMGANKSMQSISKICKAVSGIKEVTENLDKSLRIHKTSTKHTTRESIVDERDMIDDLLLLQPFEYRGRSHASFPEVRRSPLEYLDIRGFILWLEEHKRELYH